MCQKFYRVATISNACVAVDVANQGAAWNGEDEILARILNPLWNFEMMPDGRKEYRQLFTPQIPWNFFSLQDAIDFSMYAMKTTIETMRFQARLKTVSEPVDILVIKPRNAFWLRKKELHV